MLFLIRMSINGGWEEPMFIAGKDNVRVTGLRLQGEMYPQDYGNKDDETDESEYLVGIYAEAPERVRSR